MKIIVSTIMLCMALSLSAQTNSNKNSVTPGDLKSWVGYLASDDMRGRMNGSDEMKEASEWLAAKFEEFGLRSFSSNNGYFQPYEISRRGLVLEERNVIGFIEGSDPDLKNEYIVITAHFDHVGVRGAVKGDSIYNGADDNAAGTAALIGVAKALNINPEKPGRSIIFASVSGEEMGLHGSRFFVKNPPVDLKDIYVNVNFEMIGHSEELGRGKYYITGTDFLSLDEMLKEYNKDKDIELVDTIAMTNRLFYMSDNIAFATAKKEGETNFGIPGATFATTTMGSHIHKPTDELKLFDLENMANLVNYFSEMVLWLSNNNDPVEWTDSKFKRLR